MTGSIRAPAKKKQRKGPSDQENDRIQPEPPVKMDLDSGTTDATSPAAIEGLSLNLEASDDDGSTGYVSG